MKLCILSHCFYPSTKRGGPTVSVTNLAKALSQACQVSVVTIGNEAGSKETYKEIKLGKNRLFCCDVYYLKDNTIHAFYDKLQDIDPDCIYVSSLFSWEYSIAALLYKQFSRKDVRLVIAPRGELMPSALAIGAAKKKLFLSIGTGLLGLKSCIFHATAQEEKGEIEKLFPHSKIFVASNISLLDSPPQLDTQKKPGSLRLLTVGRFHPIKNIKFALQTLQELKGDVQFHIYGNKEDAAYFDDCMEYARSLPQNIQVTYFGSVSHDELKEIYPQYDIYLSPTHTENFGHSIVEALHSGVPAIISDRTPWRDLEQHTAGKEISLREEKLFTTTLQQFVDMDSAELLTWKQGALDYSKRIDAQMDIQTYYKMLGISK